MSILTRLPRIASTGALFLGTTLGLFAQTNITTWQVNLQHTGANLTETILTPSLVSGGGFGLRFTSPVMDGQIYGQPLVMSNLDFAGTPKTLVYVATERGWIYAIDGHNASASFVWSKSLIPAGSVYVPQADVNSGDISDALSITATPVIDPNTQTIYVLVKYKTGTTYTQRLHALDLKTGDDKPGSPVVVNPTFAGSSNWNGTESSGGVIPFNPLRSHARCALALYNGVVYLAYASHSDTDPYHGEIVGFDAATLQWIPSKTFISTPNGQKAGFWAGGASPAIDSNGNMYVMTGNGPFDQNSSPYTTGTNWGMSILKLPTSAGAFTVTFANPLNWFTPNNWPTINNADADLGSSGVLLLPDQAGPHPHLLVGGGKGGQLIILDRDAMGGLATPNNSVQEITEAKSLFVTPAYFNNYIYYAPAGDKLLQRAVGYNPADGKYISTNPFKSNFTYNGGHGSHAFITANGNANGIVWVLDLGGPAKIHAYNATNVTGDPIYTGSATIGGDIYAGRKFCVPTVANGKVYFTADNNNASRLFVFGPPPPAVGSPTAPANLTATPITSGKIVLNWDDNSNNESAFKIKRATAAGGPYTVLPLNANADQHSYVDDTGLNPATVYYYQVVATNSNGDSDPTNTATATTFPLFKPTGLVSYWNFDEGTGGVAFDVTGSGRNGTLNGELAFDVGYQNTAMSFHGTGAAFSNVAIPDSAALRFSATDSFTLSAWIKQEAVHAGQSEAVIVKSREAGNYYGIYINASNQWAFRGPGGDVTGPAASTNVWTHVTVVQDGTDASTGRKIYVNGTLSASGPTQAADGTGDFWIGQGKGDGVAVESFPGHIDEVRLYNRALAAAEVPTLLAPPVLQAESRQVHGLIGPLEIILSPATAKVVESRRGSTQGSYSIILNFSSPVSGIAASLKKQSDGTSATGTVGTITYDSTGRIVTIPLTGVANAQSTNIRLTNIVSGGGTAGTLDVPFNVLWGDVNRDNKVDSLDLNIVQGQRGVALSDATARYDIDCDGQIGAPDENLVASLIGASIGAQTASNIALFRPSTATSSINGNTANKAFDGDTTLTRWESATSDPQTLTVNLGSISTIQSFVVNWEAAAGKTYTIDVSNDGNTWNNAATEANNLAGPVILPYTSLVSSGKYVRLRGTARTGNFSYSPFEFEVYGIPGTASPDPVPVVTATNANGAVSNNFTYQIAATNNPTSYNATGLPAGLTINQSSGTITGSPTATGTSTVTLTAVNASGAGTATITIDVQPAPTAPPQITSPLTASAVIMAPFSYQITANRVPTSYTATGLPPGLTLNPLTGLITGTPVVSGTANIVLTATNGIGTTNPGATLVLTTTGGSNSNLALGKNTSTTTAVHTGNIPAYAVDNDQNISRWESEHGIDPADMTIDLGQICTINSIVLNWQNASGKTYTIDVSDNGVGGWNTIVNEPNNPGGGGYRGYSTGGATGRYVRLIGTARTTGYGYSLFEFQVWGTVGGAPTNPPVINSSLTATGTMNNAFSYQIAASGSPSSFNATNLPPGLSVNPLSGIISGTPTTTGTTPISISATNIIGTDTKTLNLTVNLPVPVITSALTKTGVLNTALTYQITASNGPTSYSASGLPPGLAIDTSTGAITGAPTAAGNTSATINATNTYGTGTATLVFNIAAALDVNLAVGKTATTNSVENAGSGPEKAVDGLTGTRWATAWLADPGTITVDLGQLCTIRKVTLMWEGAGGKDYTLTGSNDGTTFNIPIATVVGNTTTGVANPLNYTPPGGVVTARYVRMNGTARILQPYGYSLWEFQIWGAVGVIPVVNSTLTQSGTVGTPLSYSITGTNTPTGYNATNLPPGLSINTATGVISGTPTAAGTTNTTISAVNAAGSGSATLVFTIGAGVSAPVINSTLTKSGTVGTPLTYSITGTNTPASYSATGLPPGLDINTSTGVISGTPTAAGTTNATISATNAGGTGNATLVFTIDPAAPVYTPYQQWKLDNSLAINAPSNTDVDGDGLPLLMEYALGLDPAVISSTGRPVLANTGGNLTLTYAKVRSDVTYVVETSTDMVSWTTSGVNQGTPGSNVTASIPLSSDTKRFLRLRVSVPTP